VVEHLHDAIGARTLFATHYHELAGLAEVLPRLRVYRMEVAERDGAAIFLHRVAPGASDSSYGVHVARMAGLPERVTARAADLIDLSLISSPAPDRDVGGKNSDGKGPLRVAEGQALYTADAASRHEEGSAREVALALASVNVAATTPIEAINLLFALQQRALAVLQSEPARVAADRS
jgi:DNA mismatch repair protein MutS